MITNYQGEEGFYDEAFNINIINPSMLTELYHYTHCLQEAAQDCDNLWSRPPWGVWEGLGLPGHTLAPAQPQH